MRSTLLLLLVLSLCTAAPLISAQTPSGDARAHIESLLNGPEHQDFPWKTAISAPRLMFQQRYLVEVRARISAEQISESRNKRSLQFILRVQDADGKWLANGQYNDYEVPNDLSNQKEIEYASGVYLRPGTYTVALVAFSPATGKSNVFRHSVRVDPLKDDPFPEIDKYVPEVEFPVGFPQELVDKQVVTDGELFPMAHQEKWVAIANSAPILIDVVLNISKRDDSKIPEPIRMVPYYRRGLPPPPGPVRPDYHVDIGRVLQIGNVLAHLNLASGCVRVSAIDVLRTKRVVDRANEEKLDWSKFEDQIAKFDQNTVDAAVLSNKRAPAKFTHDFLQELASDKGACDSAARHYVMVVSHGVSMPSGAKDERLTPADGERARFYYIENNNGGPGDDLAEILKPTKPERLGFSSPRDFRKSFARIVQDLRAGK